MGWGGEGVTGEASPLDGAGGGDWSWLKARALSWDPTLCPFPEAGMSLDSKTGLFWSLLEVNMGGHVENYY